MDSKGFYSFIDEIPSDSLFKLTFGSIIIFITISNFIPPVFNNLFALFISISFFFFFRDKELSDISDINSDLYYKYSIIQDLFSSKKSDLPLFLHFDPDLILLFHNIIDFYSYHPSAFLDSVSSADHFLRLYSDIDKGSINCSENKELADKYASDCLNHFHSLIFKLPSNKFINEKFEYNKKRLHLLLRRKQDEMHLICSNQRKNNPITFNTKFNYNSGPKPVVSGTSFNIDPFDFFYI